MSRPYQPVESRFWKFVTRGENEDDCWRWSGSTLKNRGYGQIGINGKNDYAHRVSYRIHFGDILEGLEVLHKCDNPPCCNPKHLFLGTQKDNMEDMKSKGRRGRMKLSIDSVPIIRQLIEERRRHEDIAKEYGVARTTITAIARNQNWREIP